MTATLSSVMHRLAPVGGPLAGRLAEMETLRDAWADAAAGRGGTVLLAGEAGVGKTRLAAELASEVDGEGAVVLVGACPTGGAEPFHALVEALGPLPGARVPRFDGVVEMLAAQAVRAPVLLVLDDLHRADRSTLLAVQALAARAADCRLLVVATYRDAAVDRSHPLSELLAALLPLPGVQRVGVVGLPATALVEMVGDVELARILWRQSEGNPVRVGELLRLAALDRPLPPSFDELVAWRMEPLTRPARAFLEAAAVSGSEFYVDVVATAAGVTADRAPAALKQSGAAGFIVEEPAGPGGTRRFVHDMVREAIEGGLDASARVRLHLRLGQALDRRGKPGPGRVPAAKLAWHFRAAAPVGGSAAALRHSRAAGDRAMDLRAWEEAVVHYGYALAWATGVNPDFRIDLLLALGEAQRLSGETARARKAFLDAAALARGTRDGARMARATLALGQLAAVWGADPELEELAGEARTLLGNGAAAPARLPSAEVFASEALYDVLDGIVAEPPLPAPAPGPATVPAHPTAGSAVLRARHVAMAGPEHAAERLATAGALLRQAAESGDDDLAAVARGWRLVDAVELGRMEQALADQAVHAELARRLGSAHLAADAAAWAAMRATFEGRPDDARSRSADAFALAVEAGDPEADESFLVQRWALALEWGTPEELLEVAEACQARASSGAGGRTWRASAALALVRAGRPEPAAEELRRVVDHGLGELLRDPGRLHPLSCLAEVAWLLGDGYRAAAVGPLLEPFADRMVVAGRGLVCRGSVARACGLVAVSAGRWDDAAGYFRAALAVHRRDGALALLARTRYEWSRALAERGRKGDRRRAADARKKAADLAAGLGMARLLEEIDRT